MSEKGEKIRLIQHAIMSLSETKEKMNRGDVVKESGIPDVDEILHDLDNCGYIFYVNSTEFKKTP